MVRPFALVGLSGYGALVLCAALGPGSAWALALLCLGLACVTLACRACLGFAAQRKGLLTWQEPSDVYPRALALFQGLFWVAAALAVAGGLCGMLAFRWQQAEPVQALAGEKRTLRAQVLDYPQERYHRYYYRLQVEALGQEGGPLEEVGPFTLRLSATMPLACQPYDWVECAVTFTAFDSGGGLYSTLNSRLADGFQAGAYLSQYQGIVVEENPSQPPGELLARMRRQVGRALDQLLPRREAGFLRAMVLGDGSGISETDMGNFRELGVSHILVVSGMHMTVLAAFLQIPAQAHQTPPPYLRVLGMNERGREILSRMKRTASLPVSVSLSRLAQSSSEAAALAALEAACADQYGLFTEWIFPCGLDYSGPVVKG